MTAFRAVKQPQTWQDWLAKPATIATRQDIVNFSRMQDAAWGQKVAELIVADRLWNRVKRWVRSRFSRAETPKAPEAVE